MDDMRLRSLEDLLAVWHGQEDQIQEEGWQGGHQMTDTSTYSIDSDKVKAAADWAVGEIVRKGMAQVELQPGDGTRYTILVCDPRVTFTDGMGEVEANSLVVSLVNFSTSYPWGGTFTTTEYAAKHWGLGNRQTGYVVSLFLNFIWMSDSRFGAQ